MNRRPTALLLLSLLALGTVPTAAGLVPTARAEQTEDQLAAQALAELAEPLVRSGNYYDARGHLEEARALDPTSVAVARLLSRVEEQTGDLVAAAELLTSFEGDVRAVERRARLLRRLGRHAEAEAAVERALTLDPKDVASLELRGRLLEDVGDRLDAVKAYEATNAAWARTELDTVGSLLAVARARLGIYRLTDDFAPNLSGVLTRYEEALRLDEESVETLVAAGHLYLDMHQDQHAKQQFTRANELNPHDADALLGLAEQLQFRFDSDEAKATAERALRENPKHVESLLFLAAFDLGDARYDRAEERIGQVLAVNPRHLEALGMRAALRYLRGDEKGFADEAAALRKLNRFASQAHAALSHALEEQRRFAEALVIAEQAFQIDPRDFDSLFVAARNSLNVGLDDQAKAYLEQAEKGAVYRNVYRSNFLKLLEKMERFPTRADDRFVVRMPKAEEQAYYRLLRTTLDWSMDLLETKWRFEVEDPTFISVFDEQDDFATRTIGLPGFPALGACFGRVVTLDSPRALPPGAFGWRGTLHHELAHAVTLQLSKGRVPRWLTEGISVYEERKVSPIWNREMERPLIDAIASDEVLTLAEINSAFRGSRVMFAYYQGGLMCEFIERDWGFDALREMVRLYGDGLDTPAVVREALGVEPEAFDARFLAYARELVADYHVLRRPSQTKIRQLKRHLRRDEDDVEAIALLVEGYIGYQLSTDAANWLAKLRAAAPDDPRLPMYLALHAFGEGRPDRGMEQGRLALEAGADSFQLRMALASHARSEERFADVERHLRAAIELFPVAPGPGSPRMLLARMLLAEGDARLHDGMQLLRDYVEVAEDDFRTRLELATYYETNDRPDDRLLMLEQVRDVVPLPNSPPDPRMGDPWTRSQAMDLHAALGRMYLERERFSDAELSYAIATGIAGMVTRNPREPLADDMDVAEYHFQHARALRALGRSEEARRALETCLRLDPEHPEAGALRDRLD